MINNSPLPPKLGGEGSKEANGFCPERFSISRGSRTAGGCDQAATPVLAALGARCMPADISFATALCCSTATAVDVT